MYIREYKIKNKNTGAVRVEHKLVTSVRTEKGPRQRVVMPLGPLRWCASTGNVSPTRLSAGSPGSSRCFRGMTRTLSASR